MSFSRKYLPPILAAAVGIFNGVYVFGPILREQKEDPMLSTITPVLKADPRTPSSGSQNKGQ